MGKWRVIGVALLSVGLQAQQKPVMVEHGVYDIHLLTHLVGHEEYRVMQRPGLQMEMQTSYELGDRGNKRAGVITLDFAGKTFEPEKLLEDTVPALPDGPLSVSIEDGQVTVREASGQQGRTGRTLRKPALAFVGFQTMPSNSAQTVPASLQMMMMRYWHAHGEPKELPLLRANAFAAPVEIKLVGHEAFQVHRRMVRLTRYTVANIGFGREIVWMNDSNRLAAVMTFAGGLPQETVLDEYEEHFAQLVHSGVRQEMLDLADLDKEVPAEATGTYAIVGARLIDGTGAAPVENATVLIRDGRIAAAGADVAVPHGVRVIHAEGKSLLPGLWEMHSHYSGVEFGPALLAAGVTTTRDCGGEFEFLTTVRDAIATEHVLGPRLLLAGLIDSGGPLAFGNVDVETPAEAVQAVDNYADHGFLQIKVYSQIKPEILRVIAAEAHKRGLTVTGHVPDAVTTAEGIADGMDQINHLGYVSKAMSSNGKVDVNSDAAKFTIALLKEKDIVVDDTQSWTEMASHAKGVDPASFEPGVNAAPFTAANKYRTMGRPVDEPRARQQMQTNQAVLHALIAAGVTIIPGSDTGLVGYGLDRELELYVDAGMTPMQAIQSATIVSARVMKLDKDSGTIEPGKRADLVLVDGNPIANISDIRKTLSVVTDGRLYDCKRLARSVGFTR
jgi:imidazolonepropionase-like amidohydrolase